MAAAGEGAMTTLMGRVAALRRDARTRTRLSSQQQDEPVDAAPQTDPWCQLFHEYFIELDRGDDLIFYVTTASTESCAASTSSDLSQQHDKVLVFRRGSTTRPLPASNDESINWEESVCLNCVMQVIKYKLIVALCTTNGAGMLKPIEYVSRELYATPSYRSMNTKAGDEGIDYPNLYFAVDDFDDLFDRFTITPKHTFTLELVASVDGVESALFDGSIDGEGLMRSYVAHEHDHARRNFWVSTRKDKFVFFTIAAPEKGAGMVEMAVAVADSSNTAQRAAVASKRGGMLSSLWQSSSAQTTALVSKAKSVVRGLGYTESQRLLHGASFHTFVTYLKLGWDDILGLVLERHKPPRLAVMERLSHHRVGQRLGAATTAAAAAAAAAEDLPSSDSADTDRNDDVTHPVDGTNRSAAKHSAATSADGDGDVAGVRSAAAEARLGSVGSAGSGSGPELNVRDASAAAAAPSTSFAQRVVNATRDEIRRQRSESSSSACTPEAGEAGGDEVLSEAEAPDTSTTTTTTPTVPAAT